MDKKERIEEEFELESVEQAVKEYSYITYAIAVTYNLIADELSRLCDFKQGLVTDIGTGLGDLAIEIGKRYPRLDIIGLDISQDVLDKAVSKAESENLQNVSFKFGDVHNLPFEDNSIDLVVSHGSIHHWKDIQKAFSEIYRILKPNALTYLTDLRRDAPGNIVKEVASNLPSAQAKGFINSIRASYIPTELRSIFANLGIKNFSITDQKFSRQTISKNINRLRKTPMRNVDYAKLSQVIIIRKE